MNDIWLLIGIILAVIVVAGVSYIVLYAVNRKNEGRLLEKCKGISGGECGAFHFNSIDPQTGGGIIVHGYVSSPSPAEGGLSVSFTIPKPCKRILGRNLEVIQMANAYRLLDHDNQCFYT